MRGALAIALWMVMTLPGCANRAGGEDETGVAAARGGMSPEQYDHWRKPERVIAALQLQPDHTAADVGAGRGYLTLKIAEAVGPRGRVVATDIDPAAVKALSAAGLEREADAALAPIESRRVEPDDPGLEPRAYDRILLAQVDHLLPDRVDYFRRLARALRPGGRIAIANRLQHRARLVRAAAEAGYRTVDETHDLPGQFLIVFELAEGTP